MSTIKPIEGKSVHQIQSGQVIIDICSVVKELVENSLDAGATNIEVRFKNQGLEAIEVQDNGAGITPENYETVALKHHTSKLSTYADLEKLQTFGFRGEALSSLCALSRFTVTTCLAADTPKGTKLEFETSGKLKSTGVVAAQKGTTVSVENLFKNLPVRRRELERNIKREWTRVIGVLGQYACMQTGVKFAVSSQAAKGKKTIVFSTKGNPTTRENIANVFGAKTLAALLPLNLKLELEPTGGMTQRLSSVALPNEAVVRITGHVSRPSFGEGRQLPDRQMFYVNCRPCGLPQFAKAFNEVYRAYNSSQSPFIFANIELDTHMYDVNVSPDKRTILLHDQSQMLERLKEALTELFEAQDYRVPVSQLSMPKRKQFTQLNLTSAIIERESSTTGAPETGRNNTEDISYDQKADTSPGSPVEDNNGSRQQEKTRPFESRVNLYTESSSESESESADGDIDAPSRDPKRAVDENITLERPNRLAGSPPMARSTAKNEQQQTRSYGIRVEAVSSVKEDEDSNLENVPHSTSIPVRDFNRRVSKFDFNHEREANASRFDSDQSGHEDELPIISSQPRRQVPAEPFPSQRGSIKLRSTPTSATITIGDHTITTPVGSPQRKRQKLGNFEDGKSEANEATSSQVPTFASRLSQRFAAGVTRRPDPDDESSGPESDDERPIDLEERQVNTTEVEKISEAAKEASQDDQLTNEDDQTEGDESEDAIREKDVDSQVGEGSDSDDNYIDEDIKKAKEDAKVQQMIEDAERQSSQAHSEKERRANYFIKGAAKREMTCNLLQTLNISLQEIQHQMQALQDLLDLKDTAEVEEDVEANAAIGEEKLSLTIDKGDFAKMRVVGQFNLGFILATRSASTASNAQYRHGLSDELFIIDQHASDEKYNFERLQATTILQRQPVARPKTLNLTAVEEEIVIENQSALEANGFLITVDESGDTPVGQRCQLVSLPVSRETAFTLPDLEELLGLLVDHPAGSIPRPSKVRKMFAMRACRSSIMIGRTLTVKQMNQVVKHMGELDKPWNCPHGRPTMRHLCGLSAWDEVGWREGDEKFGTRGSMTNWKAYLQKRRGDSP